MKEEILNLRASGYSYREIQKILGCSRSTICYHCSEGQKEKQNARKRNDSKTFRGILRRKKDNFSFVNGNRKCRLKRQPLPFTFEEFENKLISSSRCYLTGRTIDLTKSRSYHCDHIVPVSRGGGCNLENMGLACKEANMAKNELLVEEFLQLCKEVLIHHGYTITKEG